MSKIEEISKEYLHKFREDFAEYIKPFEEKYGIKLSLHNMSGNNDHEENSIIYTITDIFLNEEQVDRLMGEM